VLNPGESRDLPTGIAVEFPAGYWGRITGRSSTLRKRGLFVNEGVIDAGYRGELLVYVTNRQSTRVEVASGERLAQLIVQPVVQAPAEWSDELSPSDRGTNGFGSTGGNGGVASGLRRGQTFSVGPVQMYDALPDRFPVYLGGAVDQSRATHTADDWRHSRLWGEAGVWTYCPKCECTGITDPAEIIKKNMAAIRNAPMAVFDLTEQSIGTPIEAWLRIEELRLPAVVIFGTGFTDSPQSVFVNYWMRHPFVHLATGRSGIAEWVRSLMRREVSPGT
jgi:dUTP pyrophosphatase